VREIVCNTSISGIFLHQLHFLSVLKNVKFIGTCLGIVPHVMNLLIQPRGVLSVWGIFDEFQSSGESIFSLKRGNSFFTIGHNDERLMIFH
jgi:hypothetical protein